MGGPIILPTCCFFCVLDSSAAASAAPHPQHSNLETKPFPCSSGPLLLAPRNMPSKLPFAFLFSASSSLGFSFKRGQQASLSVAPPAHILLGNILTNCSHPALLWFGPDVASHILPFPLASTPPPSVWVRSSTRRAPAFLQMLWSCFN